MFMLQAPVVTSPVARHLILTDAETNALMSKGEDCAAGECSIDDVAELIAELKETEKALEERLEKIMNMVGHLQHINEKEERKTDDVRQFVKDMLRVFSSDVSYITQKACFLWRLEGEAFPRPSDRIFW
jgi:hypothetical protein